MDDELWGNAWGSTTDSKPSLTAAVPKPSSSPGLTPTWPTQPVPTPSFSDAWGPSAWGTTTTTTASTSVDDSGGGWGDSLEYDTQAPEPVVSHTESDIPVEIKEEEEAELQEVSYSPSVERQTDIPHSPLPSSPPPEGSQTTDSRSSSPSHDVPTRTSIEEVSNELPVTPRVTQNIVRSPDLDDSFGGFETGNDVGLGVSAGAEEDPWSPAPGDLTFPPLRSPARVEDDVVAGDDAWGSKDEEPETEEEPVADEWERARIRKERMDRKIPPEVVSGYLSQWESVVAEIWPDAPLPRSEPSTDWRSPLEDISELQTLRKMYRLPTLTTTLSSPPPVLSPLPPYSSTQIHTRQRGALKSTRVSAVAQLSPFAHLTSARSIQAAHRFSSKPSVSISKSSLDFGDDVVGVGWAWAHDEKKKLEPVVAPTPIVTASSPSPSPTPSTPTAGRFSGFWARARGSTDKSSASVGQGSRSGTPVPLTSPSTSSLGDTTKPPAAEPTVESPSSQPQPPSAPAEPAASGVSRFFKRFSRSNPLESERTRLAVSESVSLSASDLDFLADSVPDTTEKSLLDGGRGLTEFDALEAMLKTKPLPKDVPVLAPPPRVGPSGGSGASSPLAAVPENAKVGDDDLWDIFGAPPAATSNGHSSTPLIAPPATPQRTIPAPSLTPKLTTPVSSAPASRSHTPRLPSVADLATIVGGKGSHLRQTSFSGRPQQAFRADVPSLDSPPIPALPPPPGSNAAAAPLMEIDPFDEFVSAPASNPVESSSSRASFDDFGDFESSAPVYASAAPIPQIAPPTIISSPSPPKPPSKTGTPVFVRTGTNIKRVDNGPAALPPLLPPPSAPNRSMTPVIAPPPAPTPFIAPPAPQMNLFDFGSSPPKSNTPIPAPAFTQKPSTTTAPSKGGLSASDLSFFEGL